MSDSAHQAAGLVSDLRAGSKDKRFIVAKVLQFHRFP